MSEAQRAAVVTEARSWIGTFYHHMGTLKATRDADGAILDRGGVDCATLLACVYAAAGVIPPVEVPYYPRDWHLHRSAERYLAFVLDRATEIDEARALPGDVVLYKFGRAFAHGAIIVDPAWPNIVHAKWRSDRVHEDHGDTGEMVGRPRRFFTLWP
jgi:cell wall-associated NlpC family hydrolase